MFQISGDVNHGSFPRDGGFFSRYLIVCFAFQNVTELFFGVLVRWDGATFLECDEHEHPLFSDDELSGEQWISFVFVFCEFVPFIEAQIKRLFERLVGFAYSLLLSVLDL